MFKHLVLWQFSPEVSPARRETLIRELTAGSAPWWDRLKGCKKRKSGKISYRTADTI